MNPHHRRMMQFVCTFCGELTSVRIHPTDYDGGIRGPCGACGSYTVLLGARTAEGVARWTGCTRHGWTGGDKCDGGFGCDGVPVDRDDAPDELGGTCFGAIA